MKRELEYGLPGGIVVSDEEFEHFERCMANPQPPSEAILRGAKLLREIRSQREKANRERLSLQGGEVTELRKTK